MEHFAVFCDSTFQVRDNSKAEVLERFPNGSVQLVLTELCPLVAVQWFLERFSMVPSLRRCAYVWSGWKWGIVKESESIKQGFRFLLTFFLGISEVTQECLLNSVDLFNSSSHLTTKRGCDKQVG